MKSHPRFLSRNAIYVVVTACALGAAACQPVEMDQSSPSADHAVQKIRVNTLSPGAVETDRMLLRFGSMDKARELLGAKHLMQRLGRPEENAHAALFLASDASSFMTGSDLRVDGGYNAV